MARPRRRLLWMMPKSTWKNNRQNHRGREVSYPADSGGAGISTRARRMSRSNATDVNANERRIARKKASATSAFSENRMMTANEIQARQKEIHQQIPIPPKALTILDQLKAWCAAGKGRQTEA